MAQAVSDELIAITIKKSTVLTDKFFDALERFVTNEKELTKTTTKVEDFFKNKNLLLFKSPPQNIIYFEKLLAEKGISFQIRGEKNSEDCYVFLQGNGKNKEEVKDDLKQVVKEMNQRKPSILNALKEAQEKIKKQDLASTKDKEKNKHPSQER